MRKFLGAALFLAAFGLVAYGAVVNVREAAKPVQFVQKMKVFGVELTIEGEVEAAELKKITDRYPALRK